jgi:hypothetical protein
LVIPIALACWGSVTLIVFAATTAQTFTATADSYVRQAYPDKNYGTAHRLRTGGTASAGDLQRAYLKFTVPPISGRVTKATLRLYVGKSNRTGLAVDQVTNDWTEAGITYHNAPSAGTTLGTTGALTADRRSSIPVTSVVTGAGTYSFVVSHPDGTQADVASRETSQPPQLVVETVPLPGSSSSTPVPGDATRPIRAAFYYPWFPETWGSVTNSFTNYQPTAGLYSSSDTAVIAAHVKAMRYAHLDAAISSWWGQGRHEENTRFPAQLRAADGTGFKWTLYYEKEGVGDPSVDELRGDLSYIKSHYAGDASYLKINNRPVIFVYGDGNDGCGMVDRWTTAAAGEFYLVLKVFPDFASCARQPDNWHQYGPAVAEDSQTGHSFAISPGFYKMGDSVRLSRDPDRFVQNVAHMVASKAPFQLVTTFNEWGEGTAVEPASEWASPSGFGIYLDILHNGIPAPGDPVASPDPSVTPQPDPSVTAQPEPSQPADTSPPSVPTALQASAISSSQVNLTWDASTDNVGVSGYQVLRNNQKIASVTTGLSFGDTALSASTAYTYALRAYDAAGNVSADSSPVTVTTPPAAPGPVPIGACGARPSAPSTYQHVIWIWMENHRYTDVIGTAQAPYLTGLATSCGTNPNYSSNGAPSLANYIAATSGSNQGIHDDAAPSSHNLTVDNIFRQVRAKGLTERSYQESMTTNCQLTSAGNYAVKHNPAAYYNGGSDRTACQANDVPMGTTSGGAFVHDLDNDSLPNFAFITPNLCNDTHDCSTPTGDNWLKSWMPKILASKAYQSGTTAILVVYDEYTPMPNVFIAPSVNPKTVSNATTSHFSLLRTTEEMLGIQTFLGGAATAASLRTMFNM